MRNKYFISISALWKQWSINPVFPIHRGEIMTLLFLPSISIIISALSCSLSQKYSGDTYPEVIKGFWFRMIKQLFFTPKTTILSYHAKRMMQKEWLYNNKSPVFFPYSTSLPQENWFTKTKIPFAKKTNKEITVDKTNIFIYL